MYINKCLYSYLLQSGQSYLMAPVGVVTSLTPRRHLSIHEHYSMEMLKEYEVRTPRGQVAYTPEQAKEIAEEFGKFAEKECRAWHQYSC